MRPRDVGRGSRRSSRFGGSRGVATAEAVSVLFALLVALVVGFGPAVGEQETVGRRWLALLGGEGAGNAAAVLSPTLSPPGREPAQDSRGLGDRLREFWDGVWRGDFSESSSGWTTAGQIVGGLIPYVGQAADARDSVAAIRDFWSEPGLATGGNLVMAAVAWVPGIGDAAKAVVKGSRGGDGVVKAVARSPRVGWDEALQGVRRAPGSGPVLYRGATRGPDEIFAGGFQPKAAPLQGLTLEQRVLEDARFPKGEFVNLTEDAAMAERLAKAREGWVYVIDAKKPGISTNEILGAKSPFPAEREHKFSEGIGPHEIVGARNVRTGEWMANPRYRPSVEASRSWWKLW